MEVVLLILAELAASEAWERIRGRLWKPEASWGEVAAVRLSERLGHRLTEAQRGAVSRWIERPDVFAVIAISTDDDDRGEQANQVIAALEFELGAPSERTRTLAEEVVAEVLAYVPEMVDPALAATVAAHRSVKRDLDALLDGQAVIYDEVRDLPAKLVGTRVPSDQDVRGLPPTVLPWLDRASQNGHQVGTLLAWLRQGEAIESRIAALTNQPPAWLDRSAELLVALGYVAEARGLDGPAATSLKTAAERLPDDASVLLSRVAFAETRLGNDAAAHDAISNARVIATTQDGRLLDVVEAALGQPADAGRLIAACERAVADGAPDQALISALLGKGLIASGNLDRAVSVLEEASDLYPDHSGVRLTLAHALLARVEVDNAPTRAEDAFAALKHALIVRDNRRLWAGDSGDAVELACQACIVIGDPEQALKLASHVEGEATPEEADRPALRQLIAVLRSGSEHPLPEAQTPFESALFEGLAAADHQDSRTEATSLISKAISLASDDAELDRAQRALASLGVVDIPRLDEVRERDDAHAEVVLAIAEMSGGDTKSARGRLRPLAGTVSIASLLLGEIEAEDGDLPAAARVLEAGARRFSDPRLYLAAARRFLAADLPADAERCAAAGRSFLPTGAGALRDFTEIALRAAAAMDNVEVVEALTRQAWNDGDRREEFRWLRAQALVRQHRAKDAWAEINKEPALVPESEFHASLFLQLLMRRDPRRLDLLVAALERFPDSHDVHATGLGLFLAFDLDFEIEPGLLRALQDLLAEFVERYPDSPVIRSQKVSHDSPEELVEQMREMVAPDKARDDQLEDLAAKARQGQLPIGFVASIVGRTTLEVILTGAAVGFVSIPSEPGLLDQEIDLARASLDRDVVVDETSLVLLSFLPSRWSTVMASFRRAMMAGLAYSEIADAVFRKMPSGTLRWNHEEDRPHLVDISDEELAAVRSRRSVVRDWADQLQAVDGAPAGDLAKIADMDPGHSWLAGVGAAQTHEAALLCDDPALAALARSVGVDAFGSFALLVALIQEGRLDSAELIDVLGELFEARAMDLPLTPQQICALAQDHGWPPAASIHPLARSAFWRDVREALQAYEFLLRSSPDRDIGPDALFSSILGLSRAVVAGSPDGAIATLFVITLIATEAEPDVVARLVEAARQACEIEGRGDPFEHCVRSVIDTFEQFHEPGDLSQGVVALMAELDPTDRAKVTELLLSQR